MNEMSRKQRLDNCILHIEKSDASPEEKAEALCYMAGFGVLLTGLEEQNYAGDDPSTNAVLAEIDQLCTIVGNDVEPH